MTDDDTWRGVRSKLPTEWTPVWIPNQEFDCLAASDVARMGDGASDPAFARTFALKELWGADDIEFGCRRDGSTAPLVAFHVPMPERALWNLDWIHGELRRGRRRYSEVYFRRRTNAGLDPLLESPRQDKSFNADDNALASEILESRGASLPVSHEDALELQNRHWQWANAWLQVPGNANRMRSRSVANPRNLDTLAVRLVRALRRVSGLPDRQPR